MISKIMWKIREKTANKGYYNLKIIYLVLPKKKFPISSITYLLFLDKKI